MFITIGFCAKQILGIVRSRIEIETIFSLIGILTSIRKCRLQSNFLDKLIFVSKNWPNDPRIGCKSRFNLVDVIENDLNLEEEFEGAFESNEVSGVVNLE
jgi:hypothetical protein